MLVKENRQANYSLDNDSAGDATTASKRFDSVQMRESAKNNINNKILVVDDIDRQVWEYLTLVPRVGREIAVASLLINLILPGFGTLLSACYASDNVSKT